MTPRWLLIVAGLLFVALGGLGVALPGLPTTPFLLLAAACFAKSSPRLHRWLLQSPFFGPLIQHLQETRTIPRKARNTALLMVALVGAASVWSLRDLPLIQLLVALFLIIPLWILTRLPVSESSPEK